MSTPPTSKQNALLTVPVKYALVGSLLSVALFFIMLFFDKNPLVTNRFFDFLLLPIFIFFSIKEFKKYHNNGILHFWQGMTVGFLTYLGVAIIFALFIWGYLEWISPALLQDYIADRTALLLNSKQNIIEQFDEETYSKTLADIKMVTAGDLALDDFVKKLITGFFITSVIAIIMRRIPVTETEKG